VALLLHHLQEPDVRAAMIGAWLEEWDELEAGGRRQECYGKRLTPEGWAAFADAMPTALMSHDEDWLIDRMQSASHWNPYELRRVRGGGVRAVNYNKRAAVHQLCVDEFNIAYVRGLARALLSRGDTHATVYRAGLAAEPRAECSAWEGQLVPLERVLNGHRARCFPPPGVRSAWSIPSGPNCHHSLRAAA
jgi:hypothetical protein